MDDDDSNPWGAPSSSLPSPAATRTLKVEALPESEPDVQLDNEPDADEGEAALPAAENGIHESEDTVEPEDQEDALDEEQVDVPVDAVLSSQEEEGTAPEQPQDAEEEGDAFDDDDDGFGDMAEAGEGQDDDDFGDFDDGGDAEGSFFDTPAPPPPAPAPAPARISSAFPPVRLDGITAPAGERDLPSLVTPVVDRWFSAAHDDLTAERERQVEGIGQVLTTDPLRNLLQDLSSFPPLRPVDWRRSKARREHLVALGVPVNLDDSADTKPLASLVLPSQGFSLARSSSAPPMSSPLPFPRSTTPTPRSPAFAPPPPPVPEALKPPPPLDRARAEELIRMDIADLELLSLKELAKVKEELERVSGNASAALTHALLVRERETQDAETYNNMIQDLVTAAAKMKSSAGAGAAGSGGMARASSGRGWGRKSTGPGR